MKRRVVITGMGAVTCFGSGHQPLLDAVFAGESGVRLIEGLDTTNYPVKIGAQVRDFHPEQYMNPKDARRYDSYIALSVGSAMMALEQSGLAVTDDNRGRIGIYYGSGIGGLQTIFTQTATLIERGPSRVSPLFIPNAIANTGAAVIAIQTGITGSNFAIISACSTSNHTMGEAFHAIRHGYLDACIAGGAEAAISEMGLSGFCVMKAITASWNDEPHRGSRPFDAKRDGFVMGEGAGAVILEDYETAKARGAKIYGEIVGYGSTCDAYHITAPAPGGAGAAQAMAQALADAGLQPEDIGYINAHGTSTELNDKNETEGIKKVFGDYAYQLNISSSKSMHGHLLGAAGVSEGIVTLGALSRQVIPPTINYTPNQAVPREFEYALSNSFGFGGHNAVLIFKRGEDRI